MAKKIADEFEDIARINQKRALKRRQKHRDRLNAQRTPPAEAKAALRRADPFKASSQIDDEYKMKKKRGDYYKP